MSSKLPLESLICCLVPLARNDETLRHELLAISQDILSRQVTPRPLCTPFSSLAVELVSDVNPTWGLFRTSLNDNVSSQALFIAGIGLENAAVSQSSSTSALKFTNLLSRLLEQV
jgi:hypothetical protein